MPQIQGRYTRRSGTRCTYAFRLIYGLHKGALLWSANVSRDDLAKGNPFGKLAVKQTDAEALRVEAVNQVIEAIETLTDVAE